MKLFGIKLPSLGLKDENELYYHSKGDTIFENEKLSLAKGTTVTLDTYFNCFSFKYTKYTTIESIIVALDVMGKGIIKINKVIANETSKKVDYKHITGEETTLFSQEFDCQNKERIKIPVDLDSTNIGYIYAEIIAHTPVEFFGGEYLTTKDKQNTVKIGIVICSYRREEYVLSNLRRLKKHLDNNKELSAKLEVFLIDNGKTIHAEDMPIGRVYPNKNLGGSGGFTRGIVEVHKRKEEFSHFLLMDDDIVFDSEIFDRLISILEYAKDTDSLCVGGTMLVLDKTYLQHENGANWGGMTILPNNQGFDMRCRQALLMSERNLPVTYNAWWFMCMPVSKVDKYGLPLPMFIKADDIEYGLRCCDQIMTVNGLGVWHEGFDKKYSGELEYYIKRNEMIVNAIYRPDLGALFHTKKLIRSIAKQLVYQRYYAVDFIFKAYEDFLKGPEYFLAIDGEKLHTEIRSQLPKQYSCEELEKLGYAVGENVYRGKKTRYSYLRQILTLNGYLIPSFLYNKEERKYGRVVDMFTAKPKDFYKSKTTIQYNLIAGKGFVTKQKRINIMLTLRRFFNVFIKMLLLYNRQAKEYRIALKDYF